jgi:peroxiredoxin family protein
MQTEEDLKLERGGLTEDDVRRIVRNELDGGYKDPAGNKLAIIASKGTLDWAYPPLILSTTAAASGMEAAVFFTFYGLNIIHKKSERKLKIAPVGNAAMPISDLVAALPGMPAMSTAMMKSKFKRKNVTSIGELIGIAQEFGVRLIACQMTLDAFGYKESDLIDGVEIGGAGAFLSDARRSHITLFV